MTLNNKKKSELIEKHRIHPKDSGSTEVQVALLTDRINLLNQHFGVHKKDHNSRCGLLRIVGHRRKLLSYLRKKNVEGYQRLIKELDIRK
ncbi:MAG: 30S ribosomal protein S15 [Deltaproteobacteria bacterium RIFCSPLOWO2_02_FULL_47_10]|nr:MAG: 30S ribosomal protein S15 [Deltaproteobacteria bacterium RIFCSPLOWO2_02_FULL_47_10]